MQSMSSHDWHGASWLHGRRSLKLLGDTWTPWARSGIICLPSAVISGFLPPSHHQWLLGP